jgi:hypothetical protein
MSATAKTRGAAWRDSSTTPLVGDVVITRRELLNAKHKNGRHIQGESVIPVSTIGTVSGRVQGQPLVAVDFGLDLGTVYILQDHVSVVDPAWTGVLDELDARLGETMLQQLTSQRHIILATQAKADQLLDQLKHVDVIFEETIERMRSERDHAVARAEGAEAQLAALRQQVAELADAVVYRAPSRLDSRAKALAESAGWVMSEVINDAKEVIAVTWQRTSNKSLEGEQL